MAMYNNREVSVQAPTHMYPVQESVRVQYNDGSQETVPMSQVKFTEDEKKAFVKAYPSRFEGVQTITEDDLKAVRLGIAPPSDPVVKEQAKASLKEDKQAEALQKQQDSVKAQVAKESK